MESLVATVRDPVFLMSVSIGIAIFATVLTLAIPLLYSDKLNGRMKAVSVERERIRQRERARLQSETKQRGMRRNEPKKYMSDLVTKLSLKKALADDSTVEKLRMAGYRGEAPLTILLFARFVLPFVTFSLAMLLLFVVFDLDRPVVIKLVFALLGAYAGFYAPVMFLSSKVSKRQLSIKRAFPDALDLLLICVESGMSIEQAFRKVAEEIGLQSIELAEELSLTTAELSFLPDRKSAYENLASRTGLEGVKAVCLSLIQSERYGTPLGSTLRTMAQENRDMRMNEAEKKAAALPPKLTVPMILFFLPVLFAVIMSPAIIKITNL
ncbi:type II secretion system F family protein [Methylobrevis pamukkalensis]|uniref:Bacterial type II secretion system protein F domain protein n=1 Tax=Methylobrevis pamukkalensis TaxID=1439726 RepID=A0A1E3H3M2_9HYPH|nr:type II secretion system F family protein [Methylobrevis pamukkalensis]ODN70900.1 Bacterial type II secretion system protein F domain protein [Methylobrevis pamukkalensis]